MPTEGADSPRSICEIKLGEQLILRASSLTESPRSSRTRRSRGPPTSCSRRSALNVTSRAGRPSPSLSTSAAVALAPKMAFSVAASTVAEAGKR